LPHSQEGIAKLVDCVRCHRSAGGEGEGHGGREGEGSDVRHRTDGAVRTDDAGGLVPAR